MKIIYKQFGEHFFFYVVLLFIILAGISSYYRFIIKSDYTVAYEGVCDPATEKCFMSCEDDACTKEYYYSKVVKYASDLYGECGKDITDCEAASICLPNDRQCSVTYCNPEIKNNICSVISTEPNIQNNNQDPALDGALQDSNTNNTNI